MTRLHLLLTVACVTGAAAAVAPASAERSSPARPAAVVAPASAKPASVKDQADPLWLSKFGTYDAHRGTWRLALNDKGC
jgi:hypothetical protein